MNTIQTKRDVSFEIQHAVKTLGVSYRQIAEAANVGASTISRAARAGYKVNRSTHLAIVGAINHKLTLPHGVRCIAQPVDADDVSFAQGHEISTEQLAQGLQDQVNAMRETIGSGLVDDAIESAHSREKAELQKALAARISEVQNLAADVAYEREKGLDALNQLLRAEDMLKDERLKNKTQAESIGQCFAEIHRLQGELNHQKLITASRNADLAVYQKELEAADNRADDAEYKAAEFERDLVVQRAWTWLFVMLSFAVVVAGAIK